jgi:hypothetical protein
LLDGANETLNLASVLHFEMEPLMAHKPLIAPLLAADTQAPASFSSGHRSGGQADRGK